MIKSLDLTKNSNNLYISVKDSRKDHTSLSNLGHAILFKDWKYFEKNSDFKATGLYGGGHSQVDLSETEEKKLEESLQALKAKKIHANTKKNKENLEENTQIPQYFDIFESENKHYRQIFRPKLGDSAENEGFSHVFFSTPQELRQKQKKKLLLDLNFSLKQLKIDEESEPIENNSLKKVRFVDTSAAKLSKNQQETVKNSKNSENSDKTREDDGFLLCPEGCGRRFAAISLKKHVKICRSVFQRRRDEFNSSFYRKSKESKDLENRKKLELLDKKMHEDRMNLLRKEKEIIEAKKNDPNNFPSWKKQSEALRAVMKVNKGLHKKYDADFIKEGLNTHKYVKCEGCGRLFNEKAAEKHVKNCVERAKVAKMHKRKMII